MLVCVCMNTVLKQFKRKIKIKENSSSMTVIAQKDVWQQCFCCLIDVRLEMPSPLDLFDFSFSSSSNTSRFLDHQKLPSLFDHLSSVLNLLLACLLAQAKIVATLELVDVSSALWSAADAEPGKGRSLSEAKLVTLCFALVTSGVILH